MLDFFKRNITKSHRNQLLLLNCCGAVRSGGRKLESLPHNYCVTGLGEAEWFCGSQFINLGYIIKDLSVIPIQDIRATKFMRWITYILSLR